MTGELITVEETCERLEVSLSMRDPDLTWDDSDKTSDGQASHIVDVWFTVGWGVRAYGVERNGYGQRKWYKFRTQQEAQDWFDAVAIDHT